MGYQSTGGAGQPLFDENYPSNLADDLNAVSNYAAGAADRTAPKQGWSPSIDGLASTPENQGYYTKVGGFCIAHGFFRTKDGDYLTTAANKLNLPVPAIQMAGIPHQIGTVEYTRRSDFSIRTGRVMQSTAANADNKALLFVDTVNGSRIGSTLPGGGDPFTISSTDAVYFHIRLLYRHA